jgi:hypothetical protein
VVDFDFDLIFSIPPPCAGSIGPVLALFLRWMLPCASVFLALRPMGAHSGPFPSWRLSWAGAMGAYSGSVFALELTPWEPILAPFLALAPASRWRGAFPRADAIGAHCSQCFCAGACLTLASPTRHRSRNHYANVMGARLRPALWES